jgi:hypothetical protein
MRSNRQGGKVRIVAERAFNHKDLKASKSVPLAAGGTDISSLVLNIFNLIIGRSGCADGRLSLSGNIQAFACRKNSVLAALESM